MRFLNHKVTKLVVLGIVLGLILSYLLILLPWLPAQDSTQSVRTDRLTEAITYVSGAIFGLVMIVMAYAVWKFRRRGPDDMRDGAPIHGHTGLELFWTTIPVLIVTFFGAWAGIVLHDNESVAKAGATERVVLATGSQYQWTFTYKSDGGFESKTLMLPINEGAKIETTATDVIHGFFVAEWRVKADAVPGIINRTFVTPDRLGTFRVLCSALCGPGHAGMSTINTAKVVSAADYATWVASQKKPPPARPPARRSSTARRAAVAVTASPRRAPRARSGPRSRSTTCAQPPRPRVRASRPSSARASWIRTSTSPRAFRRT